MFSFNLIYECQFGYEEGPLGVELKDRPRDSVSMTVYLVIFQRLTCL